MKAWEIDDYEGFSEIVFAETPGKAKAIAMKLALFEDYEFAELRPYRVPKADKMYKGDPHMDMDLEENWIFAVKELGWECFDFDHEYCERWCCAREFCDKYQDYLKEGR